MKNLKWSQGKSNCYLSFEIFWDGLQLFLFPSILPLVLMKKNYSHIEFTTSEDKIFNQKLNPNIDTLSRKCRKEFRLSLIPPLLFFCKKLLSYSSANFDTYMTLQYWRKSMKQMDFPFIPLPHSTVQTTYPSSSLPQNSSLLLLR